MAALDGSNEKESLRTGSDVGRSLRSNFGHLSSSFRNIITLSSLDDNGDDQKSQECAEFSKLSSSKCSRSSSFDEDNKNTPDAKMKQGVDVTKLDALERHMLIEKLIKDAKNDNLQLLQKIRKRMDKVGVKLPTVEVKYTNLHVEAECEVVHGKPLPTLWNSLQSMVSDFAKLPRLKPKAAKIDIIDDISGIIKPGRITLLLGPPGCGKTSFLKALSGNLDKSLKMTGNISYNGYNLKDIVPQKTSAYVSQNDLHIPEMTVRETLDFSACCQGTGNRAEIMNEISRKEKEAGVFPDPDIDVFMKAISVEGQKETLQTDYILKILGLDTCADVLVGNAMKRGISGGEKKRLTTGEMIVGPSKASFMDEISNGLDSSTTYQITSCLQQLAHITDATILVSLLQPAPETFDIFDDIILMAEGKIVYHGPCSRILEFFEGCGFRCPERKGVADFLQEVISRKDQAQYWHQSAHSHSYVSVRTFSEKFKQSPFGKKLDKDILEKNVMSENHDNSISFRLFSLSKWTLFKACMSREFLLMRRNSFVYIFKSAQLIIIASVTMTVFIRSRIKINALDADKYLGALFYSLVIILVDGFPEVSMTVARLAVFYKQRELCFYPAWGYAISAAILKVPLSLLEAFIWVCLTYYVIGYSPEPERFFRHLILLFAVHWTSISMFRFIASLLRTVVASTTTASLSILVVLLFGGFIIPKSSMPFWLEWAFWLSPLSYGEIGLAINEFHAPRWQKLGSTNTTIGITTLENRSLNFDGHFFWISISVLFGFILFFNVGFLLALSFLNPPGSRAIVSSVKLSQIQRSEESTNTDYHDEEKCSNRGYKGASCNSTGKAVLPFEPTSLVFQDVQYYVDAPTEMRERGFSQKKLQILHDITGALRPGVLTALMGVTGAGKTTLLDVLAGRKTCGTIKGEIKVGGYPKIQETFARISGYCEQTDIHSPQVTVEESIIFSAWMRLHPQINAQTKYNFVKDVLQTVELDGLKDALVGIPSVSGLSTEQRKRLTIAVELVANPSILFMDEPTTGLDARAAAIVMRAVKNVADTGRTIVCTIHQPSIDIFEAFDELILLKSGGRVIYSGSLGQNSSNVIEYFERIPGVASINKNYNPATWMLEVTSKSAEAELGLDFAQVYQSSALHERNKEMVKSLSIPPSGSVDLLFPTRFSQNSWGQFKSCLWKQHLSYWRSPSYNLMRLMFMIFSSFLFGLVFWDQGKKINNQQSLFNMLGLIFSATIFCGINNSSSVIPYITTERNVLYRERFAGMYAPWAYGLAQVTIEVPYIFVLSFVYVIITYPMIGYYWSAYKVLWYLYSIFCTLMYFTYMGMMLVSLTPSYPLAAIISSSSYTMLNLFSGFIIPQPQIPKWWLWLYYLMPTSWTLNGMLSSQYGDLEDEIIVFGETKTVAAFLEDYFRFHRHRLPLVGAMLILYPIVFASIFAYAIGRFNFQKR
nr:PREDICTED: pleiotropic drug resistance protein 3-like [Daucus carota subsp. sativus]XP_017234538.1 PREDICTED: pleiotropic drug resistance protein 3-like [Daucus carota subsp. sativus]